MFRIDVNKITDNTRTVQTIIEKKMIIVSHPWTKELLSNFFGWNSMQF